MTPADPRPRCLSACGPPAGRAARAHRERAAGRKPRGSQAACQASRRRQGSFRLWGKAGKTGPQKPGAGRALLPPPPKCERWALWRVPALRFPVTESALPSFLRPAFSRGRAACGRLGPVLPESWNSWQGGVCPVTRTVCRESDGRR